MRKTIVTLMLACAGQMFAGGFWLQLGNPEANPAAGKMGAVVVIKAVGCHDPAAAKVTATAIGVVNGERRSIPLELKPLGEPGAYALSQQWPKEGKWSFSWWAAMTSSSPTRCSPPVPAASIAFTPNRK